MGQDILMQRSPALEYNIGESNFSCSGSDLLGVALDSQHSLLTHRVGGTSE